MDTMVKGSMDDEEKKDIDEEARLKPLWRMAHPWIYAPHVRFGPHCSKKAASANASHRRFNH